MNRKFLGVMGIMMAACAALCGCGSKDSSAAAGTQESAAAVTTAAETEAEAEAETPSVIEQDLGSYDDIISGLKTGQSFAFADFDADNDVLLVTDGTYDNGDGNMAAIDAEIYGFDKDGNIICYGTVSSDGTAYPLAVKDGCLYFGGNHHVGKEYIDESVSSVITKEDASEEFDSDGNATYYYMSGEQEFEGEVDDDSNLQRLYEEYGEATVVNFTAVE